MRFEDIAREMTATPASYLKSARVIEQAAMDGLVPVKVGIVSTFTSQVLAPFLVVESAAKGLLAKLYFGPFNQIEQQLFDKGSALYAHQSNIIVVFARLEELVPELAGRYVQLSEAAVADSVAAIKTRISGWIAGIRQHSDANILLANFAPPSVLSAGMADASLAVSQTAAVQKCNDAMAALCRQQAGVWVFDFARLVGEQGQAQFMDNKLFFLGRIPFSVPAQIAAAKKLARCFRAILLPPAKCLVLDLDNTLWGGVLGEDGVGGVALGEDYPGSAYKAFQRYLLNLKDRGVLLAIASKNNEADVKELFASHPDCVVKLEDFAGWRINWDEKSASLSSLAAELNLGLDSLVFFDDSPVEREEVRQRLPMVTVLEVPASPLDYIQTVEASGVFDRLSLSLEDRRRAELYTKQRQREETRARFASTEEFLQSLEMAATLGPIDQETLVRVAQLVGKTNQFNLTTRRHSVGAIDDMIRNGGIGLWLRLTDRFGDNGLVGVALAVPETQTRWRIDTFLLSCRVIGRNVETVFLAELLKRVGARGGHEVLGEYLPTSKNGPVADFYSKHGFERLDDQSQRWRLNLREHAIAMPPYINVKLADAAAEVSGNAQAA